jgi:hypothetical protein
MIGCARWGASGYYCMGLDALPICCIVEQRGNGAARFHGCFITAGARGALFPLYYLVQEIQRTALKLLLCFGAGRTFKDLSRVLCGCNLVENSWDWNKKMMSRQP